MKGYSLLLLFGDEPYQDSMFVIFSLFADGVLWWWEGHRPLLKRARPAPLQARHASCGTRRVKIFVLQVVTRLAGISVC